MSLMKASEERREARKKIGRGCEISNAVAFMAWVEGQQSWAFHSIPVNPGERKR